MADKRVSTDFIVDENGNAEDVRKPKTRIKLTDKHFAKLPEEKIDKAVGGLEYNGQGDFTVAVVELFMRTIQS